MNTTNWKDIKSKMDTLDQLIKGVPFDISGDLAEPYNKDNYYGYKIKTVEMNYHNGKYIICKVKNFFGITTYQKFKYDDKYSKIENHWNSAKRFLDYVLPKVFLVCDFDNSGDTFSDFVEWYQHGEFDKCLSPTMETPEKTGYYFTD